MRRNLTRTHRYLTPSVEPGLSPQERRRRTLAECSGLSGLRDPALHFEEAEARQVAVRFIFDQTISKSRRHWVGGVPSRVELAAVERRTADLLGLSLVDVQAALKSHPKPQTCG